ANVRPRAAFWPSPTMIDERIGTIGSTQGVNASASPNSTKAGTISSRRPPFSSAAMPDSSDVSGAPVALADEPTSVGAAAPAPLEAVVDGVAGLAADWAAGVSTWGAFPCPGSENWGAAPCPGATLICWIAPAPAPAASWIVL